MSFDVYPTPPSAPLPVAAGTAGPPAEFAEHAAVDPATGRLLMVVRVVQVDAGEGPRPAPSVRLAVDDGDPTTVGADPTALSAQPGADPAALAQLTPDADDVHVIEIEVLDPGRRWYLQIANSDSVDHAYTWVVGDSDAAARRPWFDIPAPTLEFAAMAGETTTRDLLLANHGPGPLTVDDPDGADLGSGFRLEAVLPRTIGGNRSGVASIAFTAPDAPGSPSTTHAFASSDPGAGSGAGHRNRVTLSAAVRPRPRWLAGDVLVIRGVDLCRLERATGTLLPVTSDVAGAQDVAVDPRTGDALVLGAGFVKRIDRFTGQQTPLPGIPGSAPAALAVEQDGSVVVLDAGSARLTRYDPAGGVVGSAALVGLVDPRDLAREAGDDVVAVFDGSGADAKVVRVRWSTGLQSTIAADGDLSGPGGGPLAVAVDRDGTVLAVRASRSAGGVPEGRVFRIDPRNGDVAFLAGGGELAGPAALDVAADGTVLVAAAAGLFGVRPEGGASTQLTAEPVRRVAAVPALPG